MPLRRLLLPLYLLGLLWSTGPGAQSVDPEPADPAASEQQAEAPADADEAELADETPPPESEDPFDYEASEQISEDRSVSFPVDI